MSAPRPPPDRSCPPWVLCNPLRRWRAPPSQILAGGGPGPGETVADVGSGPGTFLPELVRRVGPTGSVVAVEIDPRAVARAREELRGDPLVDRIRWIPGSASEMRGIPDASVDFVLAYGLLCCLVDKDGAVDSIYRILRPGGRALFNFHCLDPPIGQRSRALRMSTGRWERLRARHPWEPAAKATGRWIRTECLRKPSGEPAPPPNRPDDRTVPP